MNYVLSNASFHALFGIKWSTEKCLYLQNYLHSSDKLIIKKSKVNIPLFLWNNSTFSRRLAI